MVVEEHLGPLQEPLSRVASELDAKLLEFGIEVPEHISLVDALVCTALALIVAILVYVVTSLVAKRDKRNAVLILGISGDSDVPAVGKTTIFKVLRHGATPKHGTVPSMAVNDATFIPHGITEPMPALRWIDFPGHSRLRHTLHNYLAVAKCIVFVVDAQRFAAQARRDAELMFDVLTDPVVANNETPLLVFCNKADTANPAKTITVQSRLEAEIERARAAHNSMLRSAGVAADGSGNQRAVEAEEERAQLGYEKELFSFGHVTGNVEFALGSAIANDVDAIIKFARSSFS